MSPSLGTLCRARTLQRLLGLRCPPASLSQSPPLEEPERPTWPCASVHRTRRSAAPFRPVNDIAQGRQHGVQLRQGQRRDPVVAQIVPLALRHEDREPRHQRRCGWGSGFSLGRPAPLVDEPVPPQLRAHAGASDH
jgi:hypothetical protein